jgi:hypothetical protein
LIKARWDRLTVESGRRGVVLAQARKKEAEAEATTKDHRESNHNDALSEPCHQGPRETGSGPRVAISALPEDHAAGAERGNNKTGDTTADPNQYGGKVILPASANARWAPPDNASASGSFVVHAGSFSGNNKDDLVVNRTATSRSPPTRAGPAPGTSAAAPPT